MSGTGRAQLSGVWGHSTNEMWQEYTIIPIKSRSLSNGIVVGNPLTDLLQSRSVPYSLLQMTCTQDGSSITFDGVLLPSSMYAEVKERIANDAVVNEHFEVFEDHYTLDMPENLGGGATTRKLWHHMEDGVSQVRGYIHESFGITDTTLLLHDAKLNKSWYLSDKRRPYPQPKVRSLKIQTPSVGARYGDSVR